MILVSFSLYGNDKKYIIGALKNARIVQEFGQNWQSVFFLGTEVPQEIENDLTRLGAIVRRKKNSWHSNGMFWRFMAINEFDYDYLIFRDVDSRISQRELDAIEQWKSSGKTLHIMRDHPHHNAIILGGMWGVTSAAKRANIVWENSFNYGLNHGEDQIFLQQEVYPALRNSIHLNDSFFSLLPWRSTFPTERDGSNYVGESVDQNEVYDESLRLVLEDFLISPIKRIKASLIFLAHKHF